MGCGGFFDIFDYMPYSRRGCGYDDRRYEMPYYKDDSENKMTLLNRMYAEGTINNEEYFNYKQRILNRTISFEELFNINQARVKNSKYSSESKENNKVDKDNYVEKINNLKNSKTKLEQFEVVLNSKLDELYADKKKMEDVAETVLKADEQKAEEFINKKLDIVESIQSLEKRRDELRQQRIEINSLIKKLETKQLESEAIKMREEMEKFKFEE